MGRISFVLLLFAGVFMSALPGQTLPNRTTARDFPVDSISVEGNRILTAPGIIAASGLRKGQNGNSSVFDEARDRLIATGYFDMVAYRYKPAASGGYQITFEVQELEMLYPIRVDGLPVSAEEVTGYLKTQDPLFSGKMPGTRQVLDRTAKQIAFYLELKGHSAEVAGRVVATAPGQLEIDFTPPRGLPAVAAVTFEGSKVISAIDLHNKMNEVAFGQPFSDSAFRMLLESQIVPLYEAKGYLRVMFPKISATPSTAVTGVDVKVTIDEGPEYKLVRVAVAGKSPAESERILKRAKLPQMTVANFDQVREAAENVKKSMRGQGFLDADVTTDRKLDDEKKTVEFFLVLDSGPEYTMGKLTVSGLGLDGEAAIRKMWSVKPGDDYPQGYAEYFLKKVKDEGIFDNLGDTRASPDVNLKTHVVDVTLDFKFARDEQKKPPQGQGFPGQIP
jgi:outer membrane protein assembly factor BamA